MSLYPSLEDMKVDKFMKAQNTPTASPIKALPPPEPEPYYDAKSEEQATSSRLYPELNEFMGLNLSAEAQQSLSSSVPDQTSGGQTLQPDCDRTGREFVSSLHSRNMAGRISLNGLNGHNRTSREFMDGLLGCDRADCEFMKSLHGHNMTDCEFKNGLLGCDRTVCEFMNSLHGHDRVQKWTPLPREVLK
ncbi:hypothetical protein cypCar_00029127 [Cyprinus carpio]|nr:hypothetical protein cypCar_00029127 [Cyprinus carpio]